MLDELKESVFGGVSAIWDDDILSGGPKCQSHLPLYMKLSENVVVALYMMFLYAWTFRTLTRVTDSTVEAMRKRDETSASKKFVLAAFCLVFGMQLAYKVISKRLIFLLNPCHALSMAQIYLLAARPNKFSLATLRVSVHTLFAAIAALLFPVTNSITLNGEVPLYWVQHLFLLCIPAYIIYVWGPSSVENLWDYSWVRVGMIVFGHYHHHILSPISELTLVNLNFMLCPAPADPVGGIYYRAFMIVSMTLCYVLIGKLYTVLVKCLLRTPLTIVEKAKKR